MGWTVNPLAYAFGGSNPSLPTTMSKKCDHTSVGMIVWQEKQLLLVERKKGMLGFAPPAGHVDQDASFEAAAKRELEEEVGLQTVAMTFLTEGRKNNLCRRPEGNWHFWKIYEVDVRGIVQNNAAETKQARFVSPEELHLLAKRTEAYLRSEIDDTEWEKDPGLEPVWHEWLTFLHII